MLPMNLLQGLTANGSMCLGKLPLRWLERALQTDWDYCDARPRMCAAGTLYYNEDDMGSQFMRRMVALYHAVHADCHYVHVPFVHFRNHVEMERSLGIGRGCMQLGLPVPPYMKEPCDYSWVALGDPDPRLVVVPAGSTWNAFNHGLPQEQGLQCVIQYFGSSAELAPEDTRVDTDEKPNVPKALRSAGLLVGLRKRLRVGKPTPMQKVLGNTSAGKLSSISNCVPQQVVTTPHPRMLSMCAVRACAASDVQIAVHVRRGEGIQGDTIFGEMRWVPDWYYENLLPFLAAQVWNRGHGGLRPVFHIFSTGRLAWDTLKPRWEERIRSATAGHVRIYWHIDGSIADDISVMADADVLLLSKSGFSGTAAQFSFGVQLSLTADLDERWFGWAGSLALPRSLVLPHVPQCLCRSRAAYKTECGVCAAAMRLHNSSADRIAYVKHTLEHQDGIQGLNEDRIPDVCQACGIAPSASGADPNISAHGCLVLCNEPPSHAMWKQPPHIAQCPKPCSEAEGVANHAAFDDHTFFCQVVSVVHAKAALAMYKPPGCARRIPQPDWQSIWALLTGAPCTTHHPMNET